MSLTTAQLNDLSGPDLLLKYNEKAAAEGKPTVKRFSDRPSALRRTAALFGIDPPASVDPKKRAMPKKAKKAKVAKAPKATKKTREKKDGEVVRPGTNRDKLFKYMEKHAGTQLSMTALMKATYGEARKDYKGPLMMVMKGIGAVIKSQGLKYKIEKTRENKENHFGLHSTAK